MHCFIPLLLGGILFFETSLNDTTLSLTDSPCLSFDTTYLDCDTIQEGQHYRFVYGFKNTGTAPLILYNVKSSCGCYVPQWPRKPIFPGDRDSVIGIYSSRGRPGRFMKSMTVNSNDPKKPTIILRCKGYALHSGNN